MTPVFLWSDWGSAAFLGLRLKQVGVPVTLYIHHKDYRMIGAGLLPKTDDPMPPKGQLVIFDGTGHGELGQLLRRRGELVIGGNPFDKELEVDRASGIKIMQAAGIQVPETKSFTDAGEAERFLGKAEGEWYIKLTGHDPGEDSTCNGDADTLTRYLRWAVTQGETKAFILQRKVEGAEVSTEGWFDGHRFVPPFNSTFEDKKLLAGDLGPRTGCEANVVWLHPRGALLPRLTVAKLESQLARHGYAGPVDLNAIVDGSGTPYGLEWTARLGFDAMQAWVRFLPRLHEQLAAFAAGGLDKWEVLDDNSLGVTVKVSVPPYPSPDPAENRRKRGFPIDPVFLSDASTYDPGDLMRGPGGPVMAGSCGIVGNVGGYGPNFHAVLQRILDTANRLDILKKQYRGLDALVRAPRDWKRLADLKLLTHRGLEEQFK